MQKTTTKKVHVRNVDRSDLLAFVFFLFAIYVLMLFLIDTSFSAILNSGLLYNGFFSS